jgi:crossover junction endodeoxyribonuclease RuvC
MTVRGIDLSLTASGIAWPGGRLVTHGRSGLTGTKMPPTSKAVALDSLAGELHRMTVQDTMSGEIRLILIETLPTSRLTVNGERSYVWWAFVRLCAFDGIPVLDVPPATLKLYASGHGDANKREVLAAVQKHLPQFDIRKVNAKGDPLKTLDDNRADAAVLCAIGMDLLGHPLAVMPAAHRKALDKLVVPGLVTL